ncbi:hypothetical protein AX17_002315 [Amanita inopinata Kibby_2008]|nr:hypothetical protein AX17_002315 [Amanita inopinata Kibby_2008]
MSPTAAPPSPQEIQRKLSVHSVSRSNKKSPGPSTGLISGTESDSDSVLANDLTPAVYPASSFGNSPSQGPLSAIAERGSASGEDTEDEEEGGWRTANMKDKSANSLDEGVIKSGYLWKKGERRKTWKKRWFVLRPHHLAYYKNSAEYQLHRLLELSDVHSCIRVTLKRHEHTFGLISPVRTFYLRASSDIEVQDWVEAIETARKALMVTSTQSSAAVPEPMPVKQEQANPEPQPSQPPPPIAVVSSSDSEDASQQITAPSPQRLTFAVTPPKTQSSTRESPKVILSGYLMKCGSKRRSWRKRWFVLTSEKLLYSGSHMDTKPHRQFPFANILDALEYDLPLSRQNLTAPYAASPPAISASSDPDESHSSHTFKIVTTKRTLLLCAPSEEDELRWLGAVRALIARRSGTGLHPGDTPKEPGKAQVAESSSGRLKGKIRRLSVSGTNAGPAPEFVHDKTS